MVKTKTHAQTNGAKAAPVIHQRSKPIQQFGTVVKLPLGLDDEVLLESAKNLNQLLADTLALRDLYKKSHWQVSGATFYQLHLLFDKHYEEQAELADTIAERIQALGGVTIAMGADVAEHTKLERPPIDREEPPVQISRLLEAHETILKESREYAKLAGQNGDDGTNDLIVSDVIRTSEAQVWFISEHLVNVPAIEAD